METLSQLKITACNIRGLSKANLKLQFKKFKNVTGNADVICLIDTHFTKQNLSVLISQRKQFFSKFNAELIESPDGRSRGSILLIRKSAGISLDNFNIVNLNCMQCFFSTASNKKLEIFFSYAPCDENEKTHHLEEIYQLIKKSKSPYRAVLGDYNSTMNFNYDTRGYLKDNHVKSRELLREWEETGTLIDAYRFYHPYDESYTWKVGKDKRGRLDYAFVCPELINFITSITHKWHSHDVSDHASVEMVIDFENTKKGAGIFRAPAEIHLDLNYQTEIKNEIKLSIISCTTEPPKTDKISRTELEIALIETRIKLEKKVIELEGTPDPPDTIMEKINNLRLTIGILLTVEPTIDELLERPCELSPRNLHEFILMKCKVLTMEYCKKLKRKGNPELNKLKQERAHAINSGLDIDALVQIEQKISNIEDENIEQKLKSRKNFIFLQDEKPTKQFLSLENSKNSYNNITVLKIPNENFDPNLPEGGQNQKEILTTDRLKISEKFRHDFQAIYAKQEVDNDENSIEHFLNSGGDYLPSLKLKSREISNDTREAMEGAITQNELKTCLFKNMKPNSAPGIDGFTVAWLRKFWFELAKLSTLAINDCYENETLTNNLKIGIIRLLRKGNKDPTITGNYRPISLLSIHYKLGSCAITQRIKNAVTSVIGRQQKAYVNNNIIGSCIINLINLINHVNKKKIESLILAIDFKKAFDSIDQNFIQKCLKAFNFGKSIQKWIKLFFKGREAYILLGGFLTEKIYLDQGVPQGDVLSPYIFILVVEILLIKINFTSQLKGINYSKKESRSETYADDTTIFLTRSTSNLENCVKILKDFTTLSGLHCNIEKTNVIPIGGNFNPENALCNHLGLQWTDNFTILGFDVDNKLENLDKNFKKIHEKVRKLALNWSKYSLNIRGKITIAKSILLPQYTYIASVLDPPENEYNYINKSIVNFINTGSVDNANIWLKAETLFTPTKKGGLGMFDAESFFNSLKISWVKRFCIDLIDDHWCDLLDRELNTNKLERSNICQWGIDKFEAIIKQNLPCISSFFKQWVKFKTVFHNRDPTTHNHLLNSPLFYNPLFKSRSNNKKLKSLKPKDFGMTECTITFGDLLGDQGICSFDEMRTNNFFRSDNLVLNYLHYQKLKKIYGDFFKHNENVPKNRSGVSIPKSKSGKTPLDFVPCTLEILKRISKGSGFFRRVLNNSKTYTNHFKLRLETKLGIKMPNALSLKMLDSLQKILPANISDMYYRLIFGKTKPKNIMKIFDATENGKCVHCGQPENFSHIFNCQKVKKFFNDFCLTTDSCTIYSEQSLLVSHHFLWGDKKSRKIIYETFILNTFVLNEILRCRITGEHLSWLRVKFKIFNFTKTLQNSCSNNLVLLASNLLLRIGDHTNEL